MYYRDIIDFVRSESTKKNKDGTPVLFQIAKILNNLKNNNIDFIPNKPLKHGNSNYFLDFYIEINNRKIDLEIDGKQHKYEDRIESDKVRDEFILNNNIFLRYGL